MPRSKRLQIANAWYHVMNRGSNHQTIFKCTDHYRIFLSLLIDISIIYEIEIHAYCLMRNHYHLLIKTNHENIAKAMKHLNSTYTLAFNRIEQRDGPLFRGRYKSILVDDDCYLLYVSRYIHLNPVEAKIVEHAENFPLSSYRAYLKIGPQPDWLIVDVILNQLKNNKNLRHIRDYQHYVETGNTQEILTFYSKKHTSPVLGTMQFQKKLSTILDSNELNSEEYEIRCHTTIPKIHFIKNYIAKFYHINERTLYNTKRGQINKPRLVAIYLCYKEFGHGIKPIAEAFKINSIATTRGALQRCKKLLINNPTLINEIGQIKQGVRRKFDRCFGQSVALPKQRSNLRLTP